MSPVDATAASGKFDMNRFLLASTTVAVAFLAFAASPARSHFIYLKQSADKNGTKVEGFFGHAPEPDEPRLLANLEGLEVWWTPVEGERQLVPLSLRGDRMAGSAPAGPGMLSAKKDAGVREREGAAYRSIRYAQASPSLESGAGISFPAEARPDLELRAQRSADGKVRLTALWKGKPLPQAEVDGSIPGVGPTSALTDEKGSVEFALDQPGFMDFHVQHVVPGEGELDGKKFSETRHNATLVVETAGKDGVARR